MLRGVFGADNDRFGKANDGWLGAVERGQGGLRLWGESIGGAELDDVVRIRGAGRLCEAGQYPREGAVPVSGAVTPMMKHQSQTAFP